MNLANMTKNDLLRHSTFRLRENAKSRGAMTVDHAGCGCGCGGQHAPTGQSTVDAAAAVSRTAFDTMNAATASGLAGMNAACAAREGKAGGAPAVQAGSGFTADAHPGTLGATGPGRYWTPASIATAAAGVWKRSPA